MKDKPMKDNDPYFLPIPPDQDPLQPDAREKYSKLRDWCLVWLIAAVFGWGVAFYLAILWP